jgi:gamma-tubulin complex component 4
MLRRQRGGADTGAPKWALRKHMSFLVDNLQYYLQVDVIESQFSILVDKIQATRDFEEIQLAHDVFLATLLGQFFLLSKPVCKCCRAN